MLPSLNIEVHFAVITLSLYIIMIIQTEVHQCENVKFENGACSGNSHHCERRICCTNKNISLFSLQCNNPERVEVLYLDNNKIDYIDKNIFEGLSNLDRLFLQNNRINKIENHSFKPLRKMKDLDLSNNLIKEMDENSFQNLTSVWRINLENNQLTIISSGVFTHSDNINQVYLTENNIEEIKEDSFKENSSLKLFYCSHNSISNLKFLKNLPKLVTLLLSHNNIKEIPTNTLLHMKALKTLDFSYNKLEILNSGTFSELSALENLSLSDNRLKFLGEGPFDYLHKLDYLDLSNNSLEEFSYYIIFEERNNLALYIYIDNNNWSCKFIHQLKQLDKRWIKLKYEHVNKSISNIDGIPCLDKKKYSDPTTSTTKNQPRTLLKYNYNNVTTQLLRYNNNATRKLLSYNNNNTTKLVRFYSNVTTVATSTTQNLVTSIFLNISTTTSNSSLGVTSPILTTTTPPINSSQEPRAKSVTLPEIKTNMTPFIIAVVAVILLLIVVIVLIAVTRRRFRRSCPSNEFEISKDGYMLPVRPPQRRSNFYVTLESYNSYEEIHELDHLYAEIDITSL